ncbi:hypothetical protein K7X08_006320 [Anisodus acutangulus]|uniref:Uncharacterized protein n=1 Tax=Anisodus acutangulus TaxID=402998 RepID=A0A9Q1RRV6_9SOLA|nr:hypothetical protein K7X08_006320 [Anisodus acutangulus]
MCLAFGLIFLLSLELAAVLDHVTKFPTVVAVPLELLCRLGLAIFLELALLACVPFGLIQICLCLSGLLSPRHDLLIIFLNIEFDNEFLKVNTSTANAAQNHQEHNLDTNEQHSESTYLNSEDSKSNGVQELQQNLGHVASSNQQSGTQCSRLKGHTS